jgi:hypothetical protein
MGLRDTEPAQVSVQELEEPLIRGPDGEPEPLEGVVVLRDPTEPLDLLLSA